MTVDGRGAHGVRVTIDEDRCIASGQCVLVAEAVFDQRDDGTAIVIADPDETQLPHVEDAVERCPARAITLS